MNARWARWPARVCVALSALSVLSALSILSILSALSARAAGAETPADPSAELAAEVERVAPRLAASPFGIPLLVEAHVEAASVRGAVRAVLAQPIEALEASLARPEDWCDVLTLHFNVKSCRPLPDGTGARTVLSIETARKLYVPPQGRRPLRYELDVSGSQPGSLHASLRAARGPLGIRDISMRFRAVGLPDGTTFAHLDYAYSTSLVTRIAMRTYLSTLGRSKVGFTVTGRGGSGEPILVTGEEGAAERNALRYHMAVVALLETATLPEPERFEARIARWFELTEQYPRQLHEMPRDEYLAMKRRERRDQEAQVAAEIRRR